MTSSQNKQGKGLGLFWGVVFLLACTQAQAGPFPEPPTESAPQGTELETAILAGGCFWGMEGLFEKLKGVKQVLSGYSGGSAADAHYEIVGSGTTGHAESIQVTYDPRIISYGSLLKVYFSVAHNPTEYNFQGPDHGTQYRSAIFYRTPAQKATAEAYIQKLEAAKFYPRPIVTQIVPFQAFYPAEDYHQRFMELHPDYPYIVHWDRPKMEALMKTWPDLLAEK